MASRRRFIALTLGIVFAVTAWPALPAHADETSTAAQLGAREEAPERWDVYPMKVFAGAAGGYGRVAGPGFAGAPDGPEAMLSADVAFEPSFMSVEAGAGWMTSRLDGQLASAAPISLRTRNGFFDASARYRLTRHWQLGPAYDLTYGTDTSFGPTVAGTSVNSLLGPRLVYESGIGAFPIRGIAQTLFALGDGGRGYLTATLGFQIGFQLAPGTHPSSPPKVEVPLHLTSAAPVSTVIVTLDPRKVFFATNSSHLRPEVTQVLQTVGAYLSDHEGMWRSLRVTGHADQRGRAQYNVALSRRRANSVVTALKASGVTADKVEVEAHGFYSLANPKNNPRAWAQNRRVELIFEGVKDPAALRAKFDELSRYELGGNG